MGNGLSIAPDSTQFLFIVRFSVKSEVPWLKCTRRYSCHPEQSEAHRDSRRRRIYGCSVTV